jgi:pyruvate,water dikinase
MEKEESKQKDNKKKINTKELKESDNVKWLSELSKKSIKVAGGKGANLAEMYNSKFPVPPAFIVTAQAYKYFIENSGLKQKIHDRLAKINIDNAKELREKAKEIQNLIKEVEIPSDLRKEIIECYDILGAENVKDATEGALAILKSAKEPVFVAVRSSATTEDLADASFAGQQETFLNIKGNNDVINAVRDVWASLFTARAIYYRQKKGFPHEKSLIAVIVQKMVNSDKSGVVFTKDPVKGTENVIVEAIFGLGEGIVSGKVLPDQYIVSRDLEILDKKTANKKTAIIRRGSGENQTVKLTENKSKQQVLTTGQIKEIANQGIRLEEHYDKPQDIEFAIENDELYIVQTRPITTLEMKDEQENVEGKIILNGLPASPGVAAGKVKIIESMDDLDKIKKGDVLVTKMTNPDMVVDMQKCDAIITDEGGATSHAAIVSREMGIPCVVGTEKATQTLKDGQKVTVDGRNGKIYEGETGQEKKAEIKPIVKTKTKIKVILDLPHFADRAAKTKSKAVGLLRLEGIIAESGKHPLLFLKNKNLEDYRDLIAKGIEKIAKNFQEVWIRTSDIRSDEYKNLEGAPKEAEINPMLGFHGIRFSLKNTGILEAELEAIKMLAEKYPDKKFGLMFPQVISVKEVKQTKKIFEKYDRDNLRFGIMVETPAACEIIEQLCNEGIEFISFGTNDLTQYTLAVDRGNEDIQELYNEMHPAVLSQIKKVIKICKENNVETSICGQAASKRDMVKFLVRQGIDSISVNADAAYELSIFIHGLEEDIKNPSEFREQEHENKEEQKKHYQQQTSEQTQEQEHEQKQTENQEWVNVNEQKKTDKDENYEDKEKKDELIPDEFPDTDIGFDVFSPKQELKNMYGNEQKSIEQQEERKEEQTQEHEQKSEERIQEKQEHEKQGFIQKAEEFGEKAIHQAEEVAHNAVGKVEHAFENISHHHKEKIEQKQHERDESSVDEEAQQEIMAQEKNKESTQSEENKEDNKNNEDNDEDGDKYLDIF